MGLDCRLVSLSQRGHRVASRRRSHGFNELEEEEKESMFTKFLSQLKEPLILLLFGSAVVSLILKQ